MQPNDMQAKIEARLRTIRILWSALFVSIGLYYVLGLFTARSNTDAPNRMLSLFLVVAGLSAVITSLMMKQRLLTQAIEKQRLDLVQSSYVIACAVCEVPALFGLLDHFVTSDPYYYVLFVISGCGMLLNFPRQQHLQDACFKVDGFNQIRY